MFCGDLQVDAPGLFGSLSKHLLSAQELSAVQAVYHKAWQRDGLTETENSRRSPGANFNPRPARLISIALRELATLVAKSELYPLILSLAENPAADQAEVPPLAQAIAILDDLRHAHLTASGSITVTIEPSLLSAIPGRLATMITAAHTTAKMLEDARR